MAIRSNGDYRTRNTALAAYLRMTGFTILDVQPGDTKSPAIFIFKPDPKIIDHEKLWQLGEAIGNLTAYWESYRLCLRMVKVGKL